MLDSIAKSSGTSVPRERVTARVSREVYATIQEAASLSGTTVNNYIVQAALENAQELIDAVKMRTIKLLSEADVAWFLNKIEEPFNPNEKLKSALRRYSEAIDGNTRKQEVSGKTI